MAHRCTRSADESAMLAAFQAGSQCPAIKKGTGASACVPKVNTGSMIYPCVAACVTQRAAFCTFSISCSEFGISFASHAMASARVFSFRPSGNSIGSSKRRGQDTNATPQTKNGLSIAAGAGRRTVHNIGACHSFPNVNGPSEGTARAVILQWHGAGGGPSTVSKREGCSPGS